VLGHAYWQDEFLDSIARVTSLSVVSVEHRLAPERPFPAGPEDCYDVAEYLVDNQLSTHSGPLKFVGGESAGATLTAQTVLHLMEARPDIVLAGACLIYVIFDLSMLPSARTWTNPLFLQTSDIQHLFDAYLPNHAPENRLVGEISPIYHPVF